MNLLVTGCNGQLGSEIRFLSSEYKDYKYLCSDINELDIAQIENIEKYIEGHKVDCIINCAAYTAVDKAESEPELAAEINIKAVSNLAKIAKQLDILLVHVSTDYVFDGNNFKPYLESDQTNPMSVYGKTKLEGEKEIINNASKAIILRTSWLYSSYGHNFVKSIMRFAKEKGQLNVVYDQIGSPTYARDLAKAILDIIKDSRYKTQGARQVDVYNYSNEGVCSWYDFAKAIVELKNIDCEIYPIETKDYPTPAKRPHYSVLSKDKIKKDHNISIPYWRDSLRTMLNKID